MAWIRGALGLSRLGRALALTLALGAPGASWAGDWTATNTAAELAFAAALAADYRQTRTIAADPSRYGETNPVLGSHPSAGQVELYFAAAAALHVGISALLPPTGRGWWQGVTLGLEVWQVAENSRRIPGLALKGTF